MVGEERHYSKIVLDLGIARNDWEYVIDADFILVQSITGDLSVNLNNVSHDEIDLKVIRSVWSPFRRLFFTNPAQPGKSAVLMFGGHASFEAERGVIGEVIITDEAGNKVKVDPTTGGLIIETLGSGFSHGNISVGTTPTLIKAANTARKSLLIQNLGTGAIYIGGSTVSTANGIKLDAGENITIDRTTAAVYGISTATQDVRFLEETD